MRVYLDTNFFIGAVEGESGELHRATWHLLSMGEQGGIDLVTSALSVAELLVKPLELELQELAATYVEMLEPGTNKGLTVIPVDQEILILAAHIRKDDRAIKLPDAIHLATAERENCSLILTDDQRLISKRPKLCRPIVAETIDTLLREIT